MPSKLETASRIAQSCRLSTIYGAVRSVLIKDLRVLAYHRVLADFDEVKFPFDLELISARADEFDWQMAYVAKNFQTVSCAEVAEAIAGGKPLPKRALMVTFDDGFCDNHDVVFPILRRHQVKALFFLSTGYIGTRQLFWFDWLVHLLLHTTVPRIRLDALDTTLEINGCWAHRRRVAMGLLRQLKRTSESKRLQVMEQLELMADVSSASVPVDQSIAMTWNDIRTMSAAGQEFGSHTVTHPILSRIADPQHLQLELDVSKTTIERETGTPVLSLAYPVGSSDAVSAEVLDATAQAGYQFAFTYQSGTNPRLADQRFGLKRIRIERYTTRNMFITALEMPEIFLR